MNTKNKITESQAITLLENIINSESENLSNFVNDYFADKKINLFARLIFDTKENKYKFIIV